VATPRDPDCILACTVFTAPLLMADLRLSERVLTYYAGFPGYGALFMYPDPSWQGRASGRLHISRPTSRKGNVYNARDSRAPLLYA
jgi:hypothetical protein